MSKFFFSLFVHLKSVALLFRPRQLLRMISLKHVLPVSTKQVIKSRTLDGEGGLIGWADTAAGKDLIEGQSPCFCDSS